MLSGDGRAGWSPVKSRPASSVCREDCESARLSCLALSMSGGRGGEGEGPHTHTYTRTHTHTHTHTRTHTPASSCLCSWCSRRESSMTLCTSCSPSSSLLIDLLELLPVIPRSMAMRSGASFSVELSSELSLRLSRANLMRLCPCILCLLTGVGSLQNMRYVRTVLYVVCDMECNTGYVVCDMEYVVWGM